MNKKMNKQVIIKTRKIITVDLFSLLEHINNCPPDNIARLNWIILNEPRYETVVEERQEE